MNGQSSASSYSSSSAAAADNGSGKSVTYSSTRGCPTQAHLSFRTVVMRGLAHDRGLFVPDAFPAVSPAELESWRALSYAELAVEVIGKFVRDDEVPRRVLADIVRRSCDAFRSKDVTPLVKVDGHYILVSRRKGRGVFLFLSSSREKLRRCRRSARRPFRLLTSSLRMTFFNDIIHLRPPPPPRRVTLHAHTHTHTPGTISRSDLRLQGRGPPDAR